MNKRKMKEMSLGLIPMMHQFILHMFMKFEDCSLLSSWENTNYLEKSDKLINEWNNKSY